MRSRGGKFRRSSCYTQAAAPNAEVACLIVKHYHELDHLIRDDITAEVFQDTYCRMTARYKSGDFVAEFKRIFYNTLREYIKRAKAYEAQIDSYADNQQGT